MNIVWIRLIHDFFKSWLQICSIIRIKEQHKLYRNFTRTYGQEYKRSWKFKQSEFKHLVFELYDFGEKEAEEEVFDDMKNTHRKT
jgi:hypothetical protein